MKQVRIQSPSVGVFEVDVQCTCGANGLQNQDTLEASFRHRVVVGGKDVYLTCGCGGLYLLRPQTDHVHILDISQGSMGIPAGVFLEINEACCHSKWYALINLIVDNGNRPLDLRKTDGVLARGVRGVRTSFPASYAMQYLNDLLRKANVSCRIVKISKGKTSTEGMIQIRAVK
jgi:hypothetical protein